MNELNGKVAVVTGGCGGIGLATVRRFLGANARVLLVDQRQDEVESAVSRLDSSRVMGLAADLTRLEESQRVMDFAAHHFGGIDVVVLGAGVGGAVKPIVDYPVDDFDEVFAINVKSTFLGMRSAIPHLQRRGGGVFVVIAASEALVGSPHRAPYSASKHATVGLVKSAALELAPLKIRVNAVAPGAVDNRMMRSVESQLAPGQAEEMKNQLAAAVPMARYALNEEIAELTLFLCGTRSSYSTGSVFVADGGVTAR